MRGDSMIAQGVDEFLEFFTIVRPHRMNVEPSIMATALEGDGPQNRRGRPKRGTCSHGQPIEICIVDDEQIVCERLQPVFEKNGFLVESFTDSKAARERLAQKKFDILITDLKMAHPDGIELLRFARQRFPRSGRRHHRFCHGGDGPPGHERRGRRFHRQAVPPEPSPRSGVQNRQGNPGQPARRAVVK